MALAVVAADKHHLVNSKGEPFFILGVNYVGYFDRSWKMWEPDLYDPDLIDRDFRKIQNCGFNTVRLFVQSALVQDIRKDNFDKLDQTLALAQDHDLSIILTLNDAHSLNLAGTGEIDARIAARYKETAAILGYNLENEPVFYNLAGGIYPKDHHPPIQTGQLIDHYGVRVQREAVADLQSRRRIPGHLDEEIAFYYINALHLFLEYDAAVKAFVNQGQGDLIDFMLSPAAEPWYTLIGVLDGTVEAWLKARTEPIRATGCRHLLTVGWHWLHFAGLPANRLLDFQEYHHFSPLSWTGFNTTTGHLQSLRRAFPQHPLVLGEFGWSNHSGRNEAGSRPVSPAQTALYEAAAYAYLRANAFAGGLKWKLNDVIPPSNPYEASFGVFREDNTAKPIGALMQRFRESYLPPDQPAALVVLREAEAGLAYRLDFPHQIIIGGATYQDRTIGWSGTGVGHCFIQKSDNLELVIETQGQGRLSLNPWDLIPAWNRAYETILYRVYGQNQRTRQERFEPGHSVVFEAEVGIRYIIAMGSLVTAAALSAGVLEPDPKPGEHVLLLVDFEEYMPGALKYIRRFGPDFTFATDEVADRWAYVSVIAPPEQVPNEVLADIRSRGAALVERVIAQTPEATKALLDGMADRGQRFLTTVAPVPPQEEPPPDPDEPDLPSNGLFETYIVQPGDTLSRIALQTYGDARLWSLIFEANRDKISEPSLIRVGMELYIPERQPAPANG